MAEDQKKQSETGTRPPRRRNTLPVAGIIAFANIYPDQWKACTAGSGKSQIEGIVPPDKFAEQRR